VLTARSAGGTQEACTTAINTALAALGDLSNKLGLTCNAIHKAGATGQARDARPSIHLRVRVLHRAGHTAVRRPGCHRRGHRLARQGDRGGRQRERRTSMSAGCSRTTGQVSRGPGWCRRSTATFVTEHHDFDVLRCVGAGEQCQPAQHTTERRLGESNCHGERSCWAHASCVLEAALSAKGADQRAWHSSRHPHVRRASCCLLSQVFAMGCGRGAVS
jgi:hypothetical protein